VGLERIIFIVVTHSLKVAVCLRRLLIGAALIASLLQSSFALAGTERHGIGRRPLMVAYFPQWGIKNQPQYLVKNLVQSGGASRLDQVNYSQGSIAGGRCSVADPTADLHYVFKEQNSVNGKADLPSSDFRGNFHQLQQLKSKYPHLKILISLEGRADAFAEDAQPQSREVFVSSCVDVFLRGHFGEGIEEPGIFDGIDVDWEYPKQQDAENYLALLREFRRQMDTIRPGFLLTVAVASTPKMYSGIDMKDVSRLVDQIGVMTYDYAGPWSSRTGFVAPLYMAAKDAREEDSIDRSVAEYKDAGVPASMLLVGLPFYGYGWQQVAATNHGLFQHGNAIHGDHPYWKIQSLSRNSTVYRKRRSRAPWLYDGDAFYTYDDPTSIRAKAKYARHEHLGGLMVWELSGDTEDARLLKTAHFYLKHSALGRLAQQRRSLAARKVEHPERSGG
jgi:chitinase